MAAATGLTIAWSGSAALCFAVVVIIAGTVRSFWHYQPAVVADPGESAGEEEGPAAGPAQEAQADAEDSRRAS
jgi:hypothetical protein